MAENSKIEWTDHTFNPWRGCTKVSPGCAHCYAETMSARNPAVLGEWGPGGKRVIAAESYWKMPLAWDRKAKAEGVRRRVFCASLADVFEDRPELVAPRVRLFHLISETSNLDWLLLTKRPENVLRMTYDAWCKPAPGHVSQNEGDGRRWSWPTNVWFGVSVEDQQRAEERIPRLLQIPAAVRFLSVEPLLGPMDLTRVRFPHSETEDVLDCRVSEWAKRAGVEKLNGVDWVIVGGESGPQARPCNVAWVRDIVRQCQEAGVPVFVKQLGAMVHTQEAADMKWDRIVRLGYALAPKGPIGAMRLHSHDPKGGDPSEWPTDLRVREFPR